MCLATCSVPSFHIAYSFSDTAGKNCSGLTATVKASDIIDILCIYIMSNHLFTHCPHIIIITQSWKRNHGCMYRDNRRIFVNIVPATSASTLSRELIALCIHS